MTREEQTELFRIALDRRLITQDEFTWLSNFGHLVFEEMGRDKFPTNEEHVAIWLKRIDHFVVRTGRRTKNIELWKWL